MRRSRSQPFLGAGGRGCGREHALPLTQSERVPLHHQNSAGQFGYWRSTKGGRLIVEELAMLQGFSPAAINWKSAGVSDKQIGSCLGNAQSLNVVEVVLPHALFLANIIDQNDFKPLAQ